MIVSTYSIAACDLDAAQWGVAVQSRFLAVGSIVPWAEPAVGAIATQAYANPRFGPDGLALLREGLGAEEVVQRSSLLTTAGTSGSSASSTRVETRLPTPERSASPGPDIARGRATPRRATSSSARRRWTRS